MAGYTVSRERTLGENRCAYWIVLSFLLRCTFSIIHLLHSLTSNAVFDQGSICIVLAGELKGVVGETPRQADYHVLDAENWTERRRCAALAACPVRGNMSSPNFAYLDPNIAVLVNKYRTR
jgi:hypothetical protein